MNITYARNNGTDIKEILKETKFHVLKVLFAEQFCVIRSFQVTGSILKVGSSTVSGQLHVVSGVNKTLTCETSVSRPAATIVWYIGTQERQRSHSIVFIFNPQNSDHNKQVYCKAFNTQPESQAVISYKSTLFVQERATVKSFYIGQNESQTVATFEEHDVNIPLTCVVSGMPASEIYVSFKGGIIARGSNTNKLQYNFGKIACDKSGVYICKGFDIFGTFASRMVELLVECSPRPIRQVLHNITSQIGSSTSLTFKVIAYPEPGPKGFKWFIEDRLNWIALLSNEDFQISSSGLETNLTISNASREHYGKYRVSAVNKIGSYDQIFFLSEKDSRSNSCTSTIKTSYTMSIVLGAVCVVVVVYAIGLTILYKRKIQKK
ncbi:limbic system-associated membrane protein-like, partial [Ruditapes philippinarum]|uniref:limbic system-associated membrane protein-like n=1 Tax=Ruditapes philippinarum TaxID=129788 RepID=UPI00295BD8DC